jgi:hypothetical protein
MIGAPFFKIYFEPVKVFLTIFNRLVRNSPLLSLIAYFLAESNTASTGGSNLIGSYPLIKNKPRSKIN